MISLKNRIVESLGKEKIISKNKDGFRVVTIDGTPYKTWFNYKKELYAKNQSFFTIELDKHPFNSITKKVDVKFDGSVENNERYDFYKKNIDFIHNETLEFHRRLQK